MRKKIYFVKYEFYQNYGEFTGRGSYWFGKKIIIEVDDYKNIENEIMTYFKYQKINILKIKLLKNIDIILNKEIKNE